MEVQISTVIDGKGIGSGWCKPVKNERDSDPEILKQKSQLAAEQIRSSQASETGGSGSNRQTADANPVKVDDKRIYSRCCERSDKGHFGWAQFGNAFIPYIFRQTEKYCSVRMAQLSVFRKYFNCLHRDIYSGCTYIRSYYITDVEARLFIEINEMHSDNEFNSDTFTRKDLVVRLSDAWKLYQFLDICYRKLLICSKIRLEKSLEISSETQLEKCGFIRINQVSVVPYAIQNNKKYVPIFYFQGDIESLNTKTHLINDWELDYIKFCCKVQGIRKELYSGEKLAVISLIVIKEYFPVGTEFKECWPNKIADCNLLIDKHENVNNSFKWYQNPSCLKVRNVSDNQW